MGEIKTITGYELIDSRGNPTVGCKVTCSGGYRGFAIVPSGASTGEHEAFELRDNESQYHGKGVKKAIEHIHGPISDLLLGKDIFDQKGIDLAMIKLDGTENKSKLGANAILGVSMAVARCAAAAKGIELYQYLSTGKVAFPTPMMNIINGGMHANNNIDFQELMISPHGFDSFKEKIRAGSEIFHSLKKILKKNNHITSVGDEGGFAPNLSSVEEALDMIIDAIKASHYKPGEQVSITLDCAASSFYMSDGYFIEKTHPEKGMRSSKEQVHYLKSLTEKYPISSIEDGLDENDWEGWQYLTKECGNIQLVGDDIFVTNIKFLKQAIEKKVGNCILIKPNQIGTVTETLETIAYAKKHGYSFIISHRSGDTEDTFIADLSLATCAPEIKTGSISHELYDYINMNKEDCLLKTTPEMFIKSPMEALVRTLCIDAKEHGYVRRGTQVLKPCKMDGVYEYYCDQKKYMNSILYTHAEYHRHKGITKQILEWLENASHPAFRLIEYKDVDFNIISFPRGFYLLDDQVFITGDEYRTKFEREPFTYHFYETDPTDDELNSKTPTPVWDKVWNDQVSQEAQNTMEVLIGRMLYKVGQYDDFQVAPFLRGVANTGKSMIVDFVGKNLLPKEEVGIISATMQQQFGLESLYEKRMIAMTEVPAHIENVIAKSVFQEMISGGTVSVTRKFKGTHEHAWSSHLFIAGNNNPDYEDDSGSIARRLAMCVFNNTIQVEKIQTNLKYKLKKETLAILFRCINSYRTFAETNAGKNWWDACDDEMRENRENISIEQNYLAEFLSNGSSYYTIVYDDGDEKTKAPEVDLLDFVRAYRNYMKIDLGLKQRIKITSSDWSPFQERGYVIDQKKMCKSCGKKASAGKLNALGVRVGRCCNKYNQKNRKNMVKIKNMVIVENKNVELDGCAFTDM